MKFSQRSYYVSCDMTPCPVLNSYRHLEERFCLYIQAFWPDVISRKKLWMRVQRKPAAEQIKHRKRKWMGHALRKDSSAKEKQAFSWNPQGQRRRGRPKER